MKKMTRLASALFLISGVAAAMPPSPPSFEKLDADGDGKLTASEVEQDHFLAEHFSEMDKNGDGAITEDEMKPAHGPGDGEMGKHGGHQPMSFDSLDANSDGVLSKDEVSNDPFLAEHFSEMDADNSGDLTADELKPAKPPKDH